MPRHKAKEESPGKRLVIRPAVERAYRRFCKHHGPEAHGKFAALELRTGDVALGDTMEDALRQARSARPKGRFLMRRIGHRAAIKAG